MNPIKNTMLTTACYLRVNNEILMIKFNGKWNEVYSPPGGHVEFGESPRDCIQREFKEETGLKLINPKLQGISYWMQESKLEEGIIFIFTANDFDGELVESLEGSLCWIDHQCLHDIPQFEQNLLFSNYLFSDELFEGKFEFDETGKLFKHSIQII